MSRRADLKLNPDAVKAANAAVGNRNLHPTDPSDAADRKRWMDSYEAAGGSTKSTSQGNGPVATPVQPCPKPCIDLEYLHCDGSGVKGAKYQIYSVDLGGNKDGFYEKSGTTDAKGKAHIANVPEISQFRYFFEKDPEVFQVKPERQPKAKPDEAAAKSALDSIGDWVWGTIQGDFNKDQSISQVAVNTILGLIPLVDQALDVRDIIAGLKDIIGYYSESDDKQKKHEDTLGLDYETWIWINVFIIAIGSIPIVGSAVKGVLKGVLVYLKKIGKKASQLSPRQLRAAWEYLVSILNHFGVGNAHKWLKEFPGKLDGWMNQAAIKIRGALDALKEMLDSTAKYSKVLGSEKSQAIIKRVDQYKKAIAKAYNRLDAMKTKVNNWLKEQVEAITKGSHKAEQRGATGTAGNKVNNQRVQTEAEAPDLTIPTRFPNTGNWRETSRTGQPKTILGRTADGYAEKADEIGANKFAIPKDKWDKMTDSERWNANREFLDDCISNKSDIQLVTNFNETSGYYFQKEKAYLLSKGYTPSPDGFSLVPPN